MYTINFLLKPINIPLLVFVSADPDTTQYSNCFDIYFLDHGNGTTGLTIYNIVSSPNELKCQDSCRDDDTCLGYTFREDEWVCSLSRDKMSIDASPCNLCRFYEKICSLCMYKTLLASIKKKNNDLML